MKVLLFRHLWGVNELGGTCLWQMRRPSRKFAAWKKRYSACQKSKSTPNPISSTT